MLNFIEKLRTDGFRITKIRRLILDLLSQNQKPIPSSKIQSYLSKNKASAHRTTIYRELLFLKEQKIIRELRLGENKRHYELMPENDHHHIICVNCEKIEDIELSKHLRVEERMITKNKKFKILMHSLEFYGLCGDCNIN